MTLARSGLARAAAATLVGLTLACCAGRSDSAAPSTTATARSGGGSKGAGATTGPGAPAIHPELAAEIPAIAGVNFAATDRAWDYKTLRLPPRAHLARRAIEVGGRAVGFVTVVEPPDGMDYDPFEDTVVDNFFASPVEIETHETKVGSNTMVVSNTVDPVWTAVGDEFVMEAADDGSIAARREWFWDGLLWIVDGTSDTRSVTQRLIAAQHKLDPPDDYDTVTIAGELDDRVPDLPHYTYIDLPRTDLADGLRQFVAGPCADQWLALGVATDPHDVSIDADNLLMQMAVIGARCDQFSADFRASMMGSPGAHDETIGGVRAMVSGADVGWIEDGIVFVASAQSPAGIARYRPFLDAFIRAQADLPPVR